MSWNRGNAGLGRPPKLRGDADTLLKLEYFGLKGLDLTATAKRFDVDPDTLRRLFRREPETGKSFAGGHAERRALCLGTTPAAVAMSCPHCGNGSEPRHGTIVITGAELADARRKFEDLVDRHIAARESEDAEGGGRGL